MQQMRKHSLGFRQKSVIKNKFRRRYNYYAILVVVSPPYTFYRLFLKMTNY